MSHSVQVERRSGEGFSPLPRGGMVRPGEAIRYSGSNLMSRGDFIVLDVSTGKEVFRRRAGVTPFVGSSFVDTVAPLVEGRYRLVRFDVNTLGLVALPFSHLAETEFGVTSAAPAPPEPPPGGFSLTDVFGDAKGLVVGLAVLVGVMAVSNALRGR